MGSVTIRKSPSHSALQFATHRMEMEIAIVPSQRVAMMINLYLHILHMKPQLTVSAGSVRTGSLSSSRHSTQHSVKLSDGQKWG